MGPAIPIGGEICVDRSWENPKLFSNEYKERFWRSFIDAQRPTRISQVAKHERPTDTVVIATAATDYREVIVRKCVMTYQLTPIVSRIEQRGDLGFAQLLSSRHLNLLGH